MEFRGADVARYERRAFLMPSSFEADECLSAAGVAPAGPYRFVAARAFINGTKIGRCAAVIRLCGGELFTVGRGKKGGGLLAVDGERSGVDRGLQLADSNVERVLFCWDICWAGLLS